MPTPLLRSSRRALAALFPLVLIAPLFAALDAPVSPNAQAGVWRTMHLLNRIEGKYILSGQQEMPAWDDTTTKSWDDDFAYIKAKTKKVPAVRGFDFLFYTHSAGGRTGQRSTERAIEWSKKGGVVAFAAHMFMLNGTNDGTNPHFYVPSANNGKGTLIDVRKVVVDGTPENKEFIEKLDLVAAELKKLQKANVPVIWRPFHESGGTWFWWSANGPEGFKAAWRFMFERYTKVHKLTNLIWCFNPADTAKLDAWYPGDDVVDMISLDVYPTAGTHPTFAEDYKKMRAYKDGRKVIAMSECGAIPDPAKMFTEGAGWSYFCTWNGFESDLTRHTVDFLKKVYTHKKVITLDELPAIRKANSLVIIDHPQPQIVVSGKKLSLSVKASGTGTLKYQWYRDGKKISGATKATYTISKAKKSHAGTYKVVVRTSKQKLTSKNASVVVTSSTAGRLSRASALATVGSGEKKLLAGFVTAGSKTKKKFLLRGLGPALTSAGAKGVLPDPKLTLNGPVKATNDNWGSNSSTSASTFKKTFKSVGATTLAKGSKDAALLPNLKKGRYNLHLTRVSSGSGLAQAEIYDPAPTKGARLTRFTARASVAKNQPLTVSFTVSGNHRTILIRGLGGSLVSGVSRTLDDPTLKLYQRSGSKLKSVTSNNDWITAPYAETTLRKIFSSVSAASLQRSGKDAVILRHLAPGDYVAQLTPAKSTTGIARLEVYEVP